MLTIWINIVISATFDFAIKAGINTGIISTLFITSLIWVAFYFYFMHGQRLHVQHIVGIVLMIAAVSLISLSKKILKLDKNDDEGDVDS